MLQISNTQKQLLPDIALCHMACFPESLATRLGKAYVEKTLEWFLVNPNRFLFHVEEDDKVIGYCGGFMPSKPGDGSSSGMLQHAFNKAIAGIIKKPLLILHPEVRQHYPFIWRNIRRKLTGKVRPAQPVTSSKPFMPYVGLVVIAVHPSYQGKGFAQQLMSEFEKRTKEFHQTEQVLSVKKNNARAINVYLMSGWKIKEEHPQTYVMNKLL